MIDDSTGQPWEIAMFEAYADEVARIYEDEDLSSYRGNETMNRLWVIIYEIIVKMDRQPWRVDLFERLADTIDPKVFWLDCKMTTKEAMWNVIERCLLGKGNSNDMRIYRKWLEFVSSATSEEE